MGLQGHSLGLGAAVCALMISGTALAEYRQAPMLDAPVADGTLPPVEQRLPANPLVLQAPEVGAAGKKRDWGPDEQVLTFTPVA